VIYPSLYEGFGLPVLDALLHGTPVLCSGNSSLMEFAGPGVEFFDPCDSGSVDEAWDRLYLQNLPISRPDLADSCSWDTFTDGLLAVVA
jgi:glycosyltransferase involved in cell wall biosynthesis